MQENEINNNLLMGRNPIREAVKKGKPVDRILVIKGNTDGSVREIIKLARERNIIVSEVNRSKLDELCIPFGYNGKPGNHQGMVAYVPEKEYVSLDDILAFAKEKGEAPFVLLLDSIMDPHNLGAIIRSAQAMGVHGIVLPKRRSAPLNASAAKASAGTLSDMRIAKQTNLVAAIKELKDKGLWIAGASQDGQPASQMDLKGPMGIVIGSEGEGLSRLVQEQCDMLASIPIAGEVESLNASVAASILMYERQRQIGDVKGEELGAGHDS